MTGYITAYVIATLLFLAIDAIWLGIVAKNFYASQMGDLMAENIRFGVAAAFYAVFTIGIVVFAVKPAIDADNFRLALGYGALFGFLAYGTYDFTNMATIRDWPVLMSVVDIVWGTTITAFTSVATYFALQKLGISF